MTMRQKINCTIRRDGRENAISVDQLLVGDILYINQGDQMPADCVLLNSTKMLADESALTGESKQLHKAPLLDPASMDIVDPFLKSGCMIAEGTGEAVICAIGTNTEMGRLQKKITEDDRELSPLQRKLERIADTIGIAGMWVAAFTVIGMCVNMLWVVMMDPHLSLFSMATLKLFINILIMGVVIIVVAVPEGLPLAVTLALAYSVSKMKDENNLVRNLNSCETMGGANNVLTDKTGTLTKNDMTAVAISIEGQITIAIKDWSTVPISVNAKSLFCENVCINATAKLIPGKDGALKKNGNPTEGAFLLAANRMGFRYEEYRIKENIIYTIPFDSKRKCMITVAKLKDDPRHYRVYVKGASDIMLKFCDFVHLNDKSIELPAEGKQEVQANTLELFSQKGYRTILFAYKDIEAEKFNPSEVDEDVLFDGLRKGLVLVAIAGIQDPLRDEVRLAVHKCHEAGVIVRMVTGDEIKYAKTIAIEAGIIDESARDRKDYTCMEGNDFCNAIGGVVEEGGKARVRNQEKFNEITSQLRVLARSKPEHKYMLVIGLKENLNNVVAVTGDGTNDALALKKSDVGFAMGICGTEVAKEAAHIILLDDNFASIITAIKWGRNIYLSVRKFLQFQVTVNMVALFLVFISGIILGESPLTSIQMLWVNLIMDTFAALALATEPPNERLLSQSPYSKTEIIITPAMARNILSQAVFQILVLCILLFGGANIL